MIEWFKQYWWAIWGLGCTIGIVLYRIHRAGEGASPRTIAQALFPVLDPNSEDNKRLPIRLLLVAGGLIVMLLFMGLVKAFMWWTTW